MVNEPSNVRRGNILINKSVLAVASAVAIMSFGATPVAAEVVTFDSQSERFFVPSVTDGNYRFVATADGFGTNNQNLWPSNGTMHLMSWTNQGSSSGFTMSSLDGSSFSLGSFLFGSGYVDGDRAATSLTVSGTGGASNFTRTFTAGVDFANGQYSTLDLGGLNATQFTFTASGLNNRASFDNFSVNAVAAVPEPGTWAMMLVGFGAVGASMRRRRTQLTAIAQLA